jgi:hypothetical protein
MSVQHWLLWKVYDDGELPWVKSPVMVVSASA